MDWNKIQGKWNQVKGNFREAFGDLTDDDLAEAAGERDQLVGKLQERCGYSQAEAERRVDEVAEAATLS